MLEIANLPKWRSRVSRRADRYMLILVDIAAYANEAFGHGLSLASLYGNADITGSTNGRPFLFRVIFTQGTLNSLRIIAAISEINFFNEKETDWLSRQKRCYTFRNSFYNQGILNIIRLSSFLYVKSHFRYRAQRFAWFFFPNHKYRWLFSIFKSAKKIIIHSYLHGYDVQF